jgi:hypothetical protein
MRTPEGTVAQPYAGWADSLKVPTVDRTIVVSPAYGRCAQPFDPSPPACTPPGELWVESPAEIKRVTIAHELGHQFDWFGLSDKGRALYRSFYPQFNHLTWTRSPVAGFNELAENFASDYAQCALRGTRWSVFSKREWKQRAQRNLRLTCLLIRGT